MPEISLYTSYKIITKNYHHSFSLIYYTILSHISLFFLKPPSCPPSCFSTCSPPDLQLQHTNFKTRDSKEHFGTKFILWFLVSHLGFHNPSPFAGVIGRPIVTLLSPHINKNTTNFQKRFAKRDFQCLVCSDKVTLSTFLNNRFGILSYQHRANKILFILLCNISISLFSTIRKMWC